MLSRSKGGRIVEKKLEEALMNVQTTYSELVEVANGMLSSIVGPVNELVAEVNSKVNAMSVDQIRDFILRLQLKAFEISEIKEKSALKAELAEALQKEKYAVEFNGADGTAAVKSNIATIAASAEVTSEALYNLIANLLKAKLDQLHRLVDALKSILMSRMQEAKFMNLGSSDEDDSFKTRIQLNEEARRQF